MKREEKKEKKQKTGSQSELQITARDILLIFWINGFGAATLVQIAAWMRVDSSTAARRIRKLVDAGLLRQLAVPLLVSPPFAATRAGCALARDPLAPLSGIRVGTWRHDSFLVDIERDLESHFHGWLEPERRFRANRRFAASRATHTPDAVIHRPGGGLIAIELELSAKAPMRLQEIINGYAATNEYERVAYLTDDEKLAKYITRFTKQFDFIDLKIHRTPEQRAAMVRPISTKHPGTQS